MATTHEITAELRKDEGKGASRRLRRAGKVPAIVYGGHKDPTSIQLEHETVFRTSQSEWFYSAILDLKVADSTEKVLLRDMQRHPFRQQIMHLDFQRVSENEAIRIRVPLHFLNQSKSPAGKISGVVISHNLVDVEVSCLPRDLPEYIEVDLATLEVGDIVHLSEIELPPGVDVQELKLGKEHDIAVVTASFVKQEVEPEVEAVAEEGVEVPATRQAADEGEDKDKDKDKDEK
ncbi:MAG TPA: 50S ribosomal protein L25/general stress protein Ctc [Xanthomonadaceae bacterium]|nr:50S ribosomal protein L25/general stress protein Ctc [Xanthomonadaceae bacterium]